MAVDREFRREVADSIAALLRGEVDSLEYNERGTQLFEAGRKANVEDSFALEWAGNAPPPFKWHSGRPIPGEMWEAFRRILAFLETDLEFVPQPVQYVFFSSKRQLCWTGASVSALAILLIALRGFTWWLLPVLWIAFGVSKHVVYFATERKKGGPRPSFNPFASERDWLVHEHLLERFRLPSSAPVLRASSLPPESRWQRVWRWMVILAAYVLTALVLVLVLAIAMPLMKVRTDKDAAD